MNKDDRLREYLQKLDSIVCELWLLEMEETEIIERVHIALTDMWDEIDDSECPG